MALNCIYNIKDGSFDGEKSNLYEELKDYHKENFEEESIIKTIDNDLEQVEYRAEYWYHYIHSEKFKNWFGDFKTKEFLNDHIDLLNDQQEPYLHTLEVNNKVYKYFKNPKGDKLYLDTHNFSGLNPQDVKDLTDHLIFQALHGGYNFDSTKEIIDNLENILDDFIDDRIEELDKWFENDQIDENLYNYAIEQMKKGVDIYNTYFSEFKEEIKNRIEDFSIAKKQIVEEETDAAGIGEVVKKESFLRNSKDSASANIRIFLTYSLPRMSRNSDGTYTKEKGNYFNATSYQSFGQAWNILEPLLSNTFNEYEVNNEGETEFVDRFEQFENKIKSRIHIAPSLKTLLARFRNLSIEQKREFIKAFNKAKVNFVSNELEKTYKDNKVSKVTVKTIEEANSTGPEHSIYIEWQRVLENRYVKDGKYNTKNTIPNHKIVLDTLEDSVKALKKYGFNISKEAIEAARIEMQENDYKEVLLSFLTGLGHIHGKPVKDKYDNIPNVLTTEKKWYKSLATMESFTRNIFGENTTRGPKGLYWNYSLPSYIDVLTDALANGDKEALNNIKSEYNRNSLLLEDIQDGKITIGTFLQGREKGKNGKDTSELTEQEDFVFQINRVLRGVLKNQKPIYNMLAAADKNRTLLLKGFRFYKTNKSPKYYDIFFNYLQDELNQYHANVENDIYYEPDLFLFAEFKDKLTEDGKLVTVLNNDHKKLVKEAVDEAVQSQIDDIKKDLGFTDVERYDIKSFSDRDKQLIDSSILDEYMNIDRALKDYVINSTIANVEMTKVYTGYPGWYKKAKEGASNKFADFFKRVPSTQTDGVYLALTKGDPKHFKLAITNKIEQKSKVLTSEKHIDNVFKMTSKYDKDLTKEQVSSILKDFNKNNIGDAQGWATPERALFILERTSKTNEDSIKLMRRVVNGERLSIPELKSLTSSFQAIKGVHYQQVNGKPVYIKYSLMPLIPQFVEGSVMNDILQKMKKDGIDELTNIDGVKVGVGTPNTITEDGKTISNLEFTNTIELENRFYKVQQELPTKDIKENNLASQIQRNILANLSKILNSEFADEPILNGRTPREVFNSIIKSQIKLLEETKNKIDKELAHVDSDKINTEVLRDKILKELKRDSPDNIIQAVEKDISLDSLPNVKERIQAVISSYFKKLVEIPVNQAAYIQVSNFGTMSLTEKESKGIIWLKEESELNGPIVENGEVVAAEVLLPINVIHKLIPNYKEIIDKEGIQGLKDKIDPKALRAIGYRIPNQGMSSNDALNIVGFLPAESGDSVVVYNGITTKTGSDFDIDKMYMFMPNLSKGFDTENITKFLNKKSEKELNEYFVKIFSNEEFVSNFDGISFNDFKKLNKNEKIDYLSEIFNEQIEYEIPFVNEELEFIRNKVIENSISTKRIVFTKDRNTKKDTQNQLFDDYYDILTAPFNYLDLVTSIDRGTEVLKNSINIKSKKYKNFTFFSGREQNKIKNDLLKGKQGVGSTANQLVNIPLVQLYDIGIKILNGSVPFGAVKDNNNNHKVTEILSAFLNAFVDIAKDDYILQANFVNTVAPASFFALRAGVPIENILSFLSNSDLIKKEIQDKEYNKSIFNKFEKQEEYQTEKGLVKAIQEASNKMTYEHFVVFKGAAKSVTDLIQSTKFEVDGPGNNIAKHITTLTKVYDLFSVDKISNIEKLFNKNTVTGRRFLNGVINVLEKEKDLFFEIEFIDLINNFSGHIKEENLKNEEFAEDVVRFLNSHIMSRVFTIKDKNVLFDNTAKSNLDNLQKKYPNNKLLYFLSTKTVGNKVYYEIDGLRNLSTNEKNDLTRAWKDLFKKEPEFAKDLVYKSFYQTGFKTELNSFHEFIPHEYLASIQSKIKEQIENLQKEENLIPLLKEYVHNNPTQLQYYDKNENLKLRDIYGKPKGILQKNKPDLLLVDDNIYIATSLTLDLKNNNIKHYVKFTTQNKKLLGKSIYNKLKNTNLDTPFFEDIMDYNISKGNILDFVKQIILNYQEKATNTFESSVEEIENTSEEVKEGVQELFESNPELANEVYSALGMFDEAGFKETSKYEMSLGDLKFKGIEPFTKEEQAEIDRLNTQQKQEAQQVYSQYLESLNTTELYSKLGNKTESGNVKVVKSIFVNKDNKNIITAFRVDKKLGLLKSFKKYNAIGNPINWQGFKHRFEGGLKVTINKNKWTKDSPKQNPDTAYVFTENINSIGKNRVGGGSAIIRNNLNAIGIVTKKYYVYSEDRATSNITGGWNQNFKDTDTDFDLFKKVNLEQFAKLDKFDSIIFPDSFANSLASIPNRFALWLQNELQTRYGLITEINSKGTGLISKSITLNNKVQSDNATIAFMDWFLGKDYIDLEQEYRQEILNNLDSLKGKTIEYYKELGRPSHATALDYLINQLGSKKDIQGFKEFVGGNNINYQLPQNIEGEYNDVVSPFEKMTKEQQVAFEKTIRDLSARIADRIGIKYVIENDKSKKYKGKIENNIAYVNLAYATLDTPIHEILGHPIIKAIKNNKTLYNNLLKELKTGKGKEVLDRIKRDYGKLEKRRDATKSDFTNNKISIDDLVVATNVKKKGKYFSYTDINGNIVETEFTQVTPLIKKLKEVYGKSLEFTNLEQVQEEAIVELLGLMTDEKLDAIKDGKLISVLKTLLKEMKAFMRSLLKQKEVEIDKLPDIMTLGDIANLLAYSNSKLILPGNEVTYTIGDGLEFKTYAEINSHIKELARQAAKYENIDLSKIEIDKKDIVLKRFLNSDKEYAQVREIIDTWKKVNDIQYNPEEAYSRGQEFIHVHNAYGSTDTRTWLQNLIPNLEDLNKANGVMEMSFLTYLQGKLPQHITRKINKKAVIKIIAYPKSKDITFASKIDNFTSSYSRELEGLQYFIDLSKVSKREQLAVNYTKSVGLSRINTIEPNIADTIDDVAHHNEYAINIADGNFRIEYGEETPYDIKKLVDSTNKILEQKYGKIVKPEIRKTALEKYGNLKAISTDPFENKVVSEKLGVLKNFKTFKEASDYYHKLQKEEDDLFFIPPTQTNETLKESIDSVKSKLGITEASKLINPEIENISIREDGSIDKRYVDTPWKVSYTDKQGKLVIKMFKTEEEARKEFSKIPKKEYTSQALNNTKISKLKKTAKKYPRSLIRSEVRPYKSTEIDKLSFQLVGDNNITVESLYNQYKTALEKNNITLQDLKEDINVNGIEAVQEKLKNCYS